MKEQIEIIQELALDMLKNDKLQGKTKVGLKGIIQACEDATAPTDEPQVEILSDEYYNSPANQNRDNAIIGYKKVAPNPQSTSNN